MMVAYCERSKTPTLIKFPAQPTTGPPARPFPFRLVVPVGGPGRFVGVQCVGCLGGGTSSSGR